MDEIQLWRVRTLRDKDGRLGHLDGDPTLYYGRIIDEIRTSLEGLESANQRLSGSAIEVSISKQEMTDRYREMYYGSKVNLNIVDLL